MGTHFKSLHSNTLFVILLLMVTNLQLHAQQKGWVDYPEFGVRFKIPEGWSGQELDKSYAMKKEGLKGFMVLFLSASTSMQSLRAEFSKEIDLGGTTLQPITAPSVKHDKVTAQYTGVVKGNLLKAEGIGKLNPFGLSVCVYVIGPENLYAEAHSQAAFQVVESIVLADIR